VSVSVHLFVRLSLLSLHLCHLVSIDQPKPGFAFSAQNETIAENESSFTAETKNENMRHFQPKMKPTSSISKNTDVLMN